MQVNSTSSSQNLLEVSHRLSENQPDVAVECLKCLVKSAPSNSSTLEDAYSLLLSIYKKNTQLLIVDPKDDPLSLLKFCKYVVKRKEAAVGNLLLVQIAKLWDQSTMMIPEKNQSLGTTICLYQFRLSLRFNFVDLSIQKSNLEYLEKLSLESLSVKQRTSINFYKQILNCDLNEIDSLLEVAPNYQKKALLLYKKAFLHLEQAKNINHSIEINQSHLKSAKSICGQLLCNNEINEIIKCKIQLLLLTTSYESVKNQDFSLNIEEIEALFNQIVNNSLVHPSECRRAKFHYAYILTHLDNFQCRFTGFNLMRTLLSDLTHKQNENSLFTAYVIKYIHRLFTRTSPVELFSYGIPFKEALQAYLKNIDNEIARYHLAELYCYGDHEVEGNPSEAKKIFNQLRYSKNNKISISAALKELEVSFYLIQNHQTTHKPLVLKNSNELSTYYKMMRIVTDARKKTQESSLDELLAITNNHIQNSSVRIYGLLTLAEFVTKENVQLTDESLNDLISNIKKELAIINQVELQGNILKHSSMRLHFLLAELMRIKNDTAEALEHYRLVYQHPLCFYRHKLIATFYVAKSLDSSNPEKYIYYFLLNNKKNVFPKDVEREIEDFMKRIPLEDTPLIEQIIERLMVKDVDSLRFGLSLSFSLYQRYNHAIFEKNLLKYVTVPEIQIYYQILSDRREINEALLQEISIPRLIELLIQPCIYEEEKIKCIHIMKRLILLNFFESPIPNNLENSVIPLGSKKNIPLFADFLRKIYNSLSTSTVEHDLLIKKRIMQILLRITNVKKLTEQEFDQNLMPVESPIVLEEDPQRATSGHQSFDSDRDSSSLSPLSLSFVLNSSDEETFNDFDWQNMSSVPNPQETENFEPMQF